jgi:hypothetical protein
MRQTAAAVAVDTIDVADDNIVDYIVGAAAAVVDDAAVAGDAKRACPLRRQSQLQY